MHVSMKRPLLYFAALLLAPLSFLATPVAGQQAGPWSAAGPAVTAVAPATSSVVPGPTAAWAALTVRSGQAEVGQTRSANAALADAIEGRQSRDVAMMIVGATAMVAGAVIGGDAGTIIMIGGGAVGILGLWWYLQ